MIQVFTRRLSAQLDANVLPGHSDIQDLLDLASIEPGWPMRTLTSGQSYSLYCWQIYYALKRVIEKWQKADRARLHEMLNEHSSSERSLAHRAAQYCLTSSLALLLSNGASLGHSRTPQDVYSDVEAATKSAEPDIRYRRTREHRRIRKLLDQSTVAPGEDCCMICAHFWDRNVLICSRYEVVLGSLSKLVRRSHQLVNNGEISWVHVPSTNVSAQISCLSENMTESYSL
jgi:hypothetical protein